MKKFGLLPLLLLSSLLLTTSFKNKEKDKIKLKKAFTSKFTYIPTSSVSLNNVETKTGAFYMLRTEVSNSDYLYFLNTLPTEELKKKHAIKAENWSQEFENNTAFEKNYHSHSAYMKYPVVNVSKESAKAYCEWLTEKYASMDIGIPDDMKIVFRLPTRAEWLSAANGGIDEPYSWGSPYVRNTDGIFLANFSAYSARHIHTDPESGEMVVIDSLSSMGTAANPIEIADITAPVSSYEPNEYGLYNMNGNVAEMLGDIDQAAGGSWRSTGYDIRNESLMPFDEASPLVGFRPIAILGKK